MYSTIHWLYKPNTTTHKHVCHINKPLQAPLNAIYKYTTQSTHYTIVKLHNLGSQLSIALTQHASIAPRHPLSDEPQLHSFHLELLSVKAGHSGRQTGIQLAKQCQNTLTYVV